MVDPVLKQIVTDQITKDPELKLMREGLAKEPGVSEDVLDEMFINRTLNRMNNKLPQQIAGALVLALIIIWTAVGVVILSLLLSR